MERAHVPSTRDPLLVHRRRPPRGRRPCPGPSGAGRPARRPGPTPRATGTSSSRSTAASTTCAAWPRVTGWPRHFDVLAKDLKIGKVYLETHRSRVTNDRETMLKVKRFFEERGIRTAGGITLVADEGREFKQFSYTDPADRRHVEDVVRFTAGLFDELILDDFFFTTTKTRERHRGQGHEELERVPPRPDARGRAVARRRAREGGEPEDQGRHQVPQLVRALPLRGVRPRERAADLRRDLHRHRDPRRDLHPAAPAGVPELLDPAVLREREARRQRRGLGRPVRAAARSTATPSRSS